MKTGVTFPDTNRIVFNLKTGHNEKRRNIKISTFTKSTKRYSSTKYSLTSERRMLKVTDISRFKKHSNLIEANKLSLQRMTLSTAPIDASTSRSPTHPIQKDKKKGFDLFPKTQGQLYKNKENLDVSPPLDRFTSTDEKLSNSSNLQQILAKNNMKKPRNLLSYNILHLQKKYNFSRFQLHNLYSMFHTLLSDSKFSIAKFKKSFEVIFNMNKISIRPQTLEKIFIQQKRIDFQNFIDMYSKIDKTIYKQNIVDYVQILFDGIYRKDLITFADITRIMKNRITQKQSVDIAKIIFQQMDRKEQQTVSLNQIYELCHSCQSFAKKMYRLYTRECKCQ